MFNEVSSQFDFPAAEAQIRSFWKSENIYEKSLEQRRGRDSFVFFEGPPTANGLPHPGHCLTRAIKDLFPRYRTMKGAYCERKAGWDTHGLPVEVEVCKELGIHSKEDIENYGMEPFIKLCQRSVFRYVKEWEELTERLGFWANLDEAYITYHQSYVESVWWVLKSLFDSGLLYQGHKIVWWWAQGGTALSAGEVGEGYREVADPSVYVLFPLVADDGATDDDASLLVWTTTPWTLPSNQFAAVHPKLDYSLVRDPADGRRFYVATALVPTIGDKVKRELETLSTCRGTDLVGRRYRPPFDDYAKALFSRREALATGGEEFLAWRVLAADFVTTDSGTGLVHQAPAFGEIDYELLQAEAVRFADPTVMPLLCAVAPNGTFTDEVPEFAGRWVKEADKDIARALKQRGLLLHQEQYLHDYPFCWRASEDPLIQYPRRSWFVRTTQFVDQMLANNQQINWLPEHIRDGRFGKFLESNVDWTLSRERYWGTPLPIWVCEASGHMEAIGSYDELLLKDGVSGVDVWERAKAEDPELCEDLKVHRPYIDAITYASPKDPNARMRRVPEVIDCWFDSGSMPFAQWGYPHRNRDKFVEQFPADFISEALDQTRGWFYSLLAIATLTFGPDGVARRQPQLAGDAPSEWPQPFRNCIVLGLIKGEDGLKMSKSKKNYKTPDYIFEHQGADAMRWLFFAGNPPWTSALFQEKAISDGQREFLIRLYNVYSFFVIYANIDGWQPSGAFTDLPSDVDYSELDRWLIGELNATIDELTTRLDAFDSYNAARALSVFVDSLSNWYVRRSRDRFWKSGMDRDKDAAYATLYHALTTTALLAAPFVPFITESMYQNLVGSRSDAVAESAPESVHLCDYPRADRALIDAALSARIAIAREVASLGRAVRAQNKLKVRLPLSLAEVVVTDAATCDELDAVREMIADELNVKAVEFTADADQYVDYAVKPNFRSLGPKYGKRAPAIQKALAKHADPAALRRAIDEQGSCEVVVDGDTVALSAEDVQVDLRAKPGWAAAQGSDVVVVLKTEVTDELRQEGMARDLVHHVQTVRKELDLAYEQRIEIGIVGSAAITDVVARHEAYIAGETLADQLAASPLDGIDGKSLSIEEHELQLWVRPL